MRSASLGRSGRSRILEEFMADSRSPRRFSRIDRLPPYVFNITAELKMAARRRGEDIIDFSMGNPDGPTPPHIVEKLVTVAQREDTHGYSTSKGIPRLRRAISNWYKDRYEVDIDPETEAIVTIGSKEGLAHLMLATLDQGDTVLVQPELPDSHLRRGDCRRPGAFGAVDTGRGLLRRTGKRDSRLDPETEDDDPWLPVEPYRSMRRAGFLRTSDRPRQTVRRFGGARPRLRRHRLRRLESPVDHASARRQGHRSGVFHPVQELQHGGLADWFHGR